MSRKLVTKFNSKISVDRDSWSNIVIAQKQNMYTGIMDLGIGMIYLAALAKPAEDKDDHYKTQEPPKHWVCDNTVCGKKIDPITHKDPGNPNTSHHNLALHVIEAKGMGDPKEAADEFCGFALRFDQLNKMSFSATSRTLNPGENGQLEPVLVKAIVDHLKPMLKMLKLDLEEAAVRVTPAQAQAARKNIPGYQGSHGTAPVGLFAQLKRV